MAVGPVDGRLYISDPEKHQVLRMKLPEESSDIKDNLEVVVGSGEKCLPGDKFSCGDGRLAKFARLAYPKGKYSDIFSGLRALTDANLIFLIILEIKNSIMCFSSKKIVY